MKRFLCTCAAVASVAMLLLLSSDRSLPAETSAIASSGDPIKVLDVKLSTSINNKATTVDGVEMQIQNTSGKPIQYLVVHALIPGSKGPLRIPLKFGNAPLPDSPSAKVEILEPGATFNLRAGSKNLCARITEQIGLIGRVPSAKEIEGKINVVIFKDRTAWAAGELLYPDPTNPLRWNLASELARNISSGGDALGVKYSKARYKTTVNECYRRTSSNLQYCCDDPANSLYVINFNFTSDPTGHWQPNTVQACCPQGSGCCTYDEQMACS